MTPSESIACSDSLIEEVKGFKGHRLSMPKMMLRQLATERFTEPCEAIVMWLLKRTPTQGGLVAWDFYPTATSRRRLRAGGVSY